MQDEYYFLLYKFINSCVSAVENGRFVLFRQDSTVSEYCIQRYLYTSA